MRGYAYLNAPMRMCSALVYLHIFSIVHRDLKPANLLRVDAPAARPCTAGGGGGGGAGDGADADDVGTWVLTDFGLATRIMASRAHTICGTPGYVAPEVARGRGGGGVGYDQACDMWAAGVILYEMYVQAGAGGGGWGAGC